MARGISRRAFLGGAAATGVLAACSGGGNGSATTTTAAPPTTTVPVPRLSGDPFTLGVASGDPTDSAVVLWTRLAPQALQPGGGMAPVDAPVRWQVAVDDGFGDVVAEGIAIASPELAHTVHVDVTGLDPGREYAYRFRIGDHESPVGRTLTMPAPGETPERFVLGQVACAQWGDGFYAGYRDLAQSGVDLVVCLGDYIYERGGEDARPGQITALTLDDYRHLYALHRSDEDLRRAHEAAPWAVTWDDHETSNDYAGDTPSEGSESRNPHELLRRRAAAYQAWWEHMPVRFDPPTGPELAIYRDLDIGGLARLHLLDTRQYRTGLECPDAVGAIGMRCAASTAPTTTFLGEDQEAWIAASLAEGERVWDVLGNSVVLHQWRFGPGDDVIWNLDQWDGFPTARDRMLDALVGAVGDVVVLTGDVHSSWVADVKADFDDPGSDRLGTELVTPGVTSIGDDIVPVLPVISSNSPHVRYAEAEHRGWLRHEVTPDAWHAEFHHVEDSTRPRSPVRVTSRWAIEPGRAVVEG